jgi:Second Messenger Oligonucleotide or Dinucleotide Synthetase domain
MQSDHLSSHLRQLCRALLMPESDRADILKIHADLKEKVSSHFISATEHYLFGSLSINCLLPLDIDPEGDIDYLIIFPSKRASPPRQYLEKVHSFCRLKLRGFSAQPNHPAILASGRLINIDLVPALRIEADTTLIPKSANEWTESNPLNNIQYYRDSNSDICKGLRVLKYLNVRLGKLIPPFHIRDFLVEERFSMIRGFEKPGGFAAEMRRIIPIYARKYGIPGISSALTRDKYGVLAARDSEILNLLPIPTLSNDT